MVTSIMTISTATMEALLTHPNSTFTVVEIHKQVCDLLGRPVAKGSVGNYITYQFFKRGITKPDSVIGSHSFTEKGQELLRELQKSAKSRFYKTAPRGRPSSHPTPDPAPDPAPDPELSSLEIGEAIIDNIEALRSEVRSLQANIIDAKLLHQKDIEAFKQVIKGRESSIRELKLDIERLQKVNLVKSRTVKLSDVARIKRP
jgi:hypothetical protein